MLTLRYIQSEYFGVGLQYLCGASAAVDPGLEWHPPTEPLSLIPPPRILK